MMTEKKANTTRMLVLSALFTALIAVGAFLKIPVPMWPFTLQTMFVAMAALLLGRRYGTLACAAYALLGLAGLPIFTGGGGPQYIFQPTFGCIVGFIVGSFIAGTIMERAPKRGFGTCFAAALVVMVVVYVLGMAWFWCIKAFYLHDPIGVKVLFLTCFAPTILPDLAKAAGAAWLTARLLPIVGVPAKTVKSI